MTRHLILKGDKTTHGGEVIECSPISRVGGIGVARVGDAVTCPIHGNTVIDKGDGALLLQGAIGCSPRRLYGMWGVSDRQPSFDL